MAVAGGPNIVEDGLVLALDAANVKSYPGSGANWNNLAGTVTGSLVNSPAFNPSNGGSLVFDGVDDYVRIGIDIGYSEGVIECWVYPKSTGGNFFVYTNNNPLVDHTHQLGISSASKLHAYIYQYGIKQFDGTSTMNINKWHHCVFWWKDGVGFGSYLNGVSQGSQVIGTSWKDGSDFWIGSNSSAGNTTNDFLDGNISNIKIYNRALTASEVLQNYNATKGRFGL